ncbi:MAG: nitroreductase family protein [Desulfatibacillaceae bacterium]
MADLMETLKTRRSIRFFEDRDLGDDVVRTILEAVQWTPSWANTQCWEIVLVSSAEQKEALAETLLKGNPAKKGMTGAPLVFALCGKRNSSGFYKDQATTKFGDWMLFDLGLACQSLCLAAWAQGVGTVVVGLLDHDRAAGVLGVPEGYEVVALIPAGYPAKESKPPRRREISEFTHHEKF